MRETKKEHQTPKEESYSLLLRGFPLFAGITPVQIESLLHCLSARVKHYDKGEFILSDSEPIRSVGIVLEGCVHMVKEDVWGGENLLAFMTQGDLFGETFAYRRDKHACVSFYSATPSTVMFVSSTSAMQTCPKSCPFHHRLVENMLSLISEKNVQLMEKIDITSRSTLREKILSYLSIQSQRQNSRYLHISLSRSELAQYLCANRSALSRELSAMREEGLIDYDRNTFILN